MARIVLVDDEGVWRELCRVTLCDLGHEVRTTGDCLEALKEMRRELPDLVILDLRMPVSGQALLYAIRDEFPALPVIVHTVYDGYRHDPSLAGVAGFAVKSPGMGELTEVVGRVTRELRPGGGAHPGSGGGAAEHDARS